jgi:RimJ/RimL family protein N-acetyltransferase
VTNYHFWRGDQIRLRAVEQKDLDAVAQSFEDLDTELDRYESDIAFPLSREQDRASLEALGKREGGDDSFFWIIENLEGQLVGYINTFDCERRAGVFKYAIVIRRPYWGRGYAREAITIVLRYYFRELRYQKLIAMVYSFNERSLRMHEKLGFTLEGRLRRTVYTNGRYYDHIFFGMTKEEFDQLDPPPELWEDATYGAPPPQIPPIAC